MAARRCSLALILVLAVTSVAVHVHPQSDPKGSVFEEAEDLMSLAELEEAKGGAADQVSLEECVKNFKVSPLPLDCLRLMMADPNMKVIRLKAKGIDEIYHYMDGVFNEYRHTFGRKCSYDKEKLVKCAFSRDLLSNGSSNVGTRSLEIDFSYSKKKPLLKRSIQMSNEVEESNVKTGFGEPSFQIMGLQMTDAVFNPFLTAVAKYDETTFKANFIKTKFKAYLVKSMPEVSRAEEEALQAQYQASEDYLDESIQSNVLDAMRADAEALAKIQADAKALAEIRGEAEAATIALQQAQKAGKDALKTKARIAVGAAGWYGLSFNLQDTQLPTITLINGLQKLKKKKKKKKK